LEALEKRVDLTDTHLNLLMENDKKQDETIAIIETSLPNLDGKLKALELADEFFQVIFFNIFFGVPHSATFVFVILMYVIDRTAYIHPVHGAGIRTHNLLSHLP
jgi:hypothetical protein